MQSHALLDSLVKVVSTVVTSVAAPAASLNTVALLTYPALFAAFVCLAETSAFIKITVLLVIGIVAKVVGLLLLVLCVAVVYVYPEYPENPLIPEYPEIPENPDIPL